MAQQHPSRNRVPSLRHHKATGRGVVTLNGKDFYCGKWSVDEPVAPKAVRNEYDRLTGIWLANGRSWPQHGEAISIARLVVKFVERAETYYRRKDGTMTYEVANIKYALKPLVLLFGPTDAASFKTADLKTVRKRMIEHGHVRTQINKAVGRIVRMFRWAAEEDLVPGAIWQNLKAVAGLKQGRCPDVVESAPVRPVSDEAVDAVVKVAPSAIAAMIRLQQLSGCRPGEVIQMTTVAIDRTGKVWKYVPETHKNEHQDKDRTIYFGPKAQAILKPWLNEDDPDAPLFSPAQTMKETRERRRLNRKTPLSRGNGPGKKATPKRVPGERYTVTAYGHAIFKACERAFNMPKELTTTELIKLSAAVKNGNADAAELAERRRQASEWRKANCWHPNQLRHTAATRFRRGFGLEAAQVLLGHSQANVTQVYAERDAAKAMEVALKAG